MRPRALGSSIRGDRMQIFPCPFCGLRDESEFHYVGEPKARPEPAASVSDAEWANYLWFNANPKGETREIWLHLTCMEMFAMTRDTATNSVVGSEALARPAP
jgi:sarcosine oxidase subunit delta